MSALLESIEASLVEALDTLRASPATDARPFRLVGRWAGETTAEGVEKETLGRGPSALLAFERSVPEEIRDGAAGPLSMILETHFFRVYVTVVDTRGPTATLQGTVGQQGILRCARLVKELLAGLDIAGLYNAEGVRLVDHQPWLIDPGTSITHVLRFSARAELGVAAPGPTPGSPFVFDASVTADAADPTSVPTISTGRTPR